MPTAHFDDATRMLIGAELGGRYRVEAALGAGGMGTVYEATDRQLDRRVAIKVIREGLNDEAAHDRFLREARAAASISHPNACCLFEVGEHEGRPFLVMELLQGEPLSQRLTRGNLTAEETLEIILPLMGAIGALHGVGLVHRDLKPSNVFLTPEGVKLLDFGLARHTKPEAAVTGPALTVPGAVTGTLRYMAPEQVTGDPVDQRTDVFALGVMLYEMLTGRIPFDATTNVDWLNAVLKDDPAPLGAAELKPLEPIVARALQRRPVDRYTSVQEMASALELALAPSPEDRPVEAAKDARTGTIVVLPFRALQDDSDVAFLQKGLPEALTTALSANPALRLVSNQAALHFDDSEDLGAFGRELAADCMLTGTYLRAGDQVRVTAQLIASADGSVQWSHVSQHAFDNPLSLQDEICAGILAALPDDLRASAANGPATPSDPA